jgi:competence protein ComEC
VRVTFIDIGQGDSTLIQAPDGHTLLVDAGGAGGGRFDIGGRVVAPVLWELGVRRLTAMVVTHGDADHMNGAESVVRDFRPREVWEGVPVASHPTLGALRLVARRAGAAWRTVQRGDRLTLGDIEVAVLHPPAADWERQRVRNDDSVALEVRCGDVSLVLPGDAEVGAELALREYLAPGPLRVLQAPHHGSASSSSEALLSAARPRVGIVSAGRGNRYGHPHAVVLDRFRRVGSQVFRTDRDGAIVVTTDGRGLRIETFSGRTAVFRSPVPPASR